MIRTLSFLRDIYTQYVIQQLYLLFFFLLKYIICSVNACLLSLSKFIMLFPLRKYIKRYKRETRRGWKLKKYTGVRERS